MNHRVRYALGATAATIAYLVAVFVLLAPSQPAMAIVAMIFGPLVVLVEHDRRANDRILRDAHRERVRERARRDGCEACWGTQMTAFGECEFCKPFRSR